MNYYYLSRNLLNLGVLLSETRSPNFSVNLVPYLLHYFIVETLHERSMKVFTFTLPFLHIATYSPLSSHKLVLFWASTSVWEDKIYLAFCWSSTPLASLYSTVESRFPLSDLGSQLSPWVPRKNLFHENLFDTLQFQSNGILSTMKCPP